MVVVDVGDVNDVRDVLADSIAGAIVGLLTEQRSCEIRREYEKL